jgi:hypothetical protein
MSHMAVAAGARALGQKQSETGQPGRAAANPTSPGPQHPMLYLQQSLGNQAVLGLLGSGSRQASGGGRPLPSVVRGLMEERFQADFGGVRVHTDSRSALLSRALQAKAFTRGSDIFFSAGRYSPGSPGGERLLAHELAHVVQQRGSAGGTPRLGDPGSSAERGAEQAAEAVMSGVPVPHPGVAPAGEIQRAPDPVVMTNGGTWETYLYIPVNDGAGAEAGKGVGAVIGLKFTPNDLVEADHIGLVQSVKTLKSTTPGGPIDTTAATSPLVAGIQLTSAQSDPGRAIDKIERNDGGKRPNTNPLYPVNNETGRVPLTLTDVGASQSFGSHGRHRRRPPASPGGPPTWETPQAATLTDKPYARNGFVGQQWRMSFEVTALVLDGPMANTYLGSVAWGWWSDATGTARLDPDPIRVVRAGAPTAQFMDAARTWNNASFPDYSGTIYDTVDLPLTTIDSGSISAADRTTSDLITRQATVDGQLKVLPAGVDRTNKEFEKRALEAELDRRHATVSVNLVKRDHLADADDLYVRLSGAGRSVQSGVVQTRSGDRFDSPFQISPLLPITGPITVEVMDKHSPDTSDQVVFVWPSPYGPTSHTFAMSGADYRVAVAFKK